MTKTLTKALWHAGPIEEYEVRDCATGEDASFRDFGTAEKFLAGWRADRPDHTIILIAIIDGG